MPYYRRNTRLPPSHYLGPQTYFVTIGCDHRMPLLRSPVFAQRVLDLLHVTASNYSFLLHAYCIMPDHIHLLAEGIHAQSNLLEFIRLFKQHTSFEFKKSFPTRLWEKSFYDYVLRPSDPIQALACYIWWNPVRKHLCFRPQDYPLTGSQTIDWMKHSVLPPDWTAPWKAAVPA